MSVRCSFVRHDRVGFRLDGGGLIIARWTQLERLLLGVRVTESVGDLRIRQKFRVTKSEVRIGERETRHRASGLLLIRETGVGRRLRNRRLGWPGVLVRLRHREETAACGRGRHLAHAIGESLVSHVSQPIRTVGRSAGVSGDAEASLWLG